MATQKPSTNGPSRVATATADDRNRQAILKQLRSDDALLAFAHEFFDEMNASQPKGSDKLAKLMDVAHGTDDPVKGTPSRDVVQGAIKQLRTTVETFLNDPKHSPTDFAKYFPSITWVTAKEVQIELDLRKARLDAGITELGEAASSVGTGFKKILGTAVSTLALPFTSVHWLVFKPTAHVWSAFCKTNGIGKIQSAAILTTLLAGMLVGSYSHLMQEVDTKDVRHLYVSGELSKQIFREACKVAGVQEGSTMTLAYALSMMPSDKTSRRYNTQMLHFISAMAGADQGVEPIVLDLISRMETGNFMSVWSRASSARGPYQSIDSTALEWMARHGTKLKAYKDAKATLTAGTYDANAHEIVSAIEQLEAEWRTDNGRTVLRNIDRGVGPAPYLTAVNFARQPIVSGQLMAEIIKTIAPELTIAKLEGKSALYVAQILADKVYPIHLLGPEGAHFLNYLANQKQDIFLDDPEKLKGHYKKFNPSASDDMAKNMANYYMKVLPKNPIILSQELEGRTRANELNITAKDLKAMIAQAMLQLTEKAVSTFDTVHSQNPTTYEACVMNKEQLSAELQARLAEIPATDTRLHIMLRHHLSPDTVKRLDELVSTFGKALKDAVVTPRADPQEEVRAKTPGLTN